MTTAVHRALYNADILHEVFQWYDIARYCPSSTLNEKRTQTLACAARVCKAFNEPATRFLWRRLTSVFPIFNLLPSLRRVDVNRRPYASRSSLNIYVLPENVPAHEWERMLTYTVHVRSIEVSGPQSREDDRLAPRSWLAMHQFARQGRILPNLRNLTWVVECYAPDQILSLISPSVTDLCLKCDCSAEDPDPASKRQWDDNFRGLLPEFFARTPRLARLTVHTGELSPSVILSRIPRLEALQHLALHTEDDADPYEPADLQPLADLPALRSLVLPSTPRLPCDGVPHPVLLPRLETLEIHRYSSRAGDVPLSSTSLHALHISHYGYTDPPSLRQSCAAWASAFPALQSLSLRLDRASGAGAGPDRPDPTSTSASQSPSPKPLAQAVAPLLALRALASVTFSLGPLPLAVSDADLTAFAEAWSALARLRICEAGPCELAACAGCTVGLKGLLALAQHCPHLARLTLPRVVVCPEELSRLPKGPSTHKLESLEVVGRWATEDGQRQIRDRIFPRLSVKGCSLARGLS
ncbi:hypothetical protein C8Q78DRAFT_1084638 [Trametes maxima]|nr:hypothetical protein C8Q78DRAFT_1084638 [Trametes maxima]